ncbi:MAG TPA: 2-succinyl-6-hydroxy-2,4-cyclohexadiene-1-carboxylate synthase, partial [Bacillaceae bacterium]
LRGMGTGMQPSWWGELSRLGMPVLLMSGELDQKFCRLAEEMEERLPYSEWVVFSNAGHAIHVEEREKFGTIVNGFLSRHSDT